STFLDAHRTGWARENDVDATGRGHNARRTLLEIRQRRSIVALRPTIEKLIRAVPRVLITNHLLDAHLVSDEAPWSESSLFLSLPQCRLALQFVCQIGTDTRPHRFVEAEA